MSLGNLTVNFRNYGVYVEGRFVELSPKEFDVLRVMVAHPDQVLPYSTFAQTLWQSADKRRLRHLNVLVYHLRQKLSRSYPFVIRTIRTRGYGLVSRQDTPPRSRMEAQYMET